MKNFEAYSAYYDLLYQDKPYEAEAEYVFDRLTRAIDPKLTTILELGCGTGKHAALLAQRNLRITGVDLSETMVVQAQTRNRGNVNLNFVQGDVRNLNLQQQFDAVISLFHVASYQTMNSHILGFMETAFRHLLPGGVFLFDFWYGPAVYTQQPVVRIKRMQNERFLVTRIAEPVHHAEQCRIDVNFEILVEDKSAGTIKRINEIHPMRYFFLPELRLLLEKSGFRIDDLQFEEWITGRDASSESWGVTAIVRKS
jgi:SAM-dependent methyltransferase